jgi:hypothetical protein
MVVFADKQALRIFCAARGAACSAVSRRRDSRDGGGAPAAAAEPKPADPTLPRAVLGYALVFLAVAPGAGVPRRVEHEPAARESECDADEHAEHEPHLYLPR